MHLCIICVLYLQTYFAISFSSIHIDCESAAARLLAASWLGRTRSQALGQTDVDTALYNDRSYARAAGGYCRISTTGSALGGIRSQVVASLSEKRQVPPRPLSTNSAWLSRQVVRPSPAMDASQPGFTVIL
jgi:hypothetical protein